MSLTSALYAGNVVHHRHRPSKHTLKYRVFCLLVDLDEVTELDRSLKLFGYNRRSVFSFWDSDHGTGEAGGLKAWVISHLSSAGIDRPGVRIRVLCYPRMFGYVFNPLTVYFCEDSGGRLLALLYEVCNTFNERHTYIIPANGATDGNVRHTCAKALYVSPFVPMDCIYDFDITQPGHRVRIAINERDADGPLLFASFAGSHRPLTNASLLKALFAYPLMTLKVMAGIHWEAFRLWRKGVPIHRHQPAPNRVASSVENPV